MKSRKGIIMKKIIVIAIVVVLVLAIGVPTAFAMGHGFRHVANGAQTAHSTSIADEIGQELADVQSALTAKGTAANNVDATACPGFSDADGDGVCDNRGSRSGVGAGCQTGHNGYSHSRHNGYHHGCK